MNYRIKDICRSRNLAIQELAKIIGMQREPLSRIVNGASTTIDTLERIANALEVPITDLFEKPNDIRFYAEYQGEKYEITEKDVIGIIETKKGG